jgi:hypothetical protein
MVRTACTEPHCLYKGALYLTLFNVELLLLVVHSCIGWGVTRIQSEVFGLLRCFKIVLLSILFFSKLGCLLELCYIYWHLLRAYTE